MKLVNDIYGENQVDKSDRRSSIELFLSELKRINFDDEEESFEDDYSEESYP